MAHSGTSTTIRCVDARPKRKSCTPPPVHPLQLKTGFPLVPHPLGKILGFYFIYYICIGSFWAM